MLVAIFNNRVLQRILVLVFVFAFSYATAQTKNEQKRLQKNSNRIALASFSKALKVKMTSEKDFAIKLAKRNGWEITKRMEDGSFYELQRIGSDGTPIYYTTASSPMSSTSRANTLHTNGVLDLGINGENMNIGLWDQGVVYTEHQEFDTRIDIGDYNADKKNNGHATHIAGIMVASGVREDAKGIAPKATVTSYNWNSDRAEVAAAAANGMLVSNHSYSVGVNSISDWYFGAYVDDARDWDKIMYNAPYYLAVIAAGNAQKKGYNESPVFGTAAESYDLIAGFALSKNSITVGAAQNIEVNTNGDFINAQMTKFSSYGPTDDGRIKPDIVSLGKRVLSTYTNGKDVYRTSSGTSIAAPGVAASLTLLQQYNKELNNSYLKAATIKGLALHTADNIGAKPGPSPKSGWGLINAKAAAEAITNDGKTTVVEELTLENQAEYTFTVVSDGTNPLMASISWTDLAGTEVKSKLNSAEVALVNDLDIRIIKNEETFFPWKLKLSQLDNGAVKGDNVVDPFEKVRVDNASGTYQIIITHKGNLKSDRQNFSIIVTGVQNKIDKEIEEVVDEVIEEEVIDEEVINEEIIEEEIEDKIEEEVIEEEIIDEEVDNNNEDDTIEEEIKDISNSRRISVYPNPSTDYIKVAVDTDANDFNYQIVNISGIMIGANKLGSDKTINVSNYKTGLYILIVSGNGIITKTKFFKN